MRSLLRRSLPILIPGLLLLPLLFRPRVYGFDPVGYYSWVRSAVIDGNLDTTDEYRWFGNDAIAGSTVTGHNHNPYPIGAPLLWLPFFLAAHGWESAKSALSDHPKPTGYETSYVISVSAGSVLFGLIAVMLMHDLARRQFGAFEARLAALGGWLATPLIFYMYSHPTMAHASDAFASALVVLAWARLRPDQPSRWFTLGAATGLAMLVRTQNALLIALPAAALIRRFWRARKGSRDRITPASASPGTLRSALIPSAAYLLGGLAAFWPQIAAWRIVYGSWIVLNPYAYSDAGQFIWGRLLVGRVLLSTDRGLLLWSPITLLAVLGLVPLYRRDRRLAGFLAWSLISQIFLVSMWSSPTGAIAFGPRLLLNNVPTYILGLAALLDRLRARGWSAWRIAAMPVAFIAWNFLLMAQYVTETIPRSGEFPLGDMIRGQFTVLPTQFDRLVQAVLTRR